MQFPRRLHLNNHLTQQIELAIARLKINGTDAAIGIDSVSEQIAVAVAEKEKKKPGPKADELKFNSINSNSNGNTLRRLARDNPELLDRIEAGELSVNAAAIEAGIRSDRPKLKDMLVKFRPKSKGGRPPKSEVEKPVDNVNELNGRKTGNSRLYIEERLQRDHPRLIHEATWKQVAFFVG